MKNVYLVNPEQMQAAELRDWPKTRVALEALDNAAKAYGAATAELQRLEALVYSAKMTQEDAERVLANAKDIVRQSVAPFYVVFPDVK